MAVEAGLASSEAVDDGNVCGVPPPVPWIDVSAIATAFADGWNEAEASCEDEDEDQPASLPMVSPRATTRGTPEATAAAEIVHAAQLSALEKAAAGSPGWLSWLGFDTEEAGEAGTLPPPPTLEPHEQPRRRIQSAKPKALGTGVEDYLGDLPHDAQQDKAYLQIRNLDTGEMVSLVEADAKLHASLTTLTPPQQARKRWTLSGWSARGIVRSGKTPQEQRLAMHADPATRATAEAAKLAQQAVAADRDGSEYMAISYYRQSVRLIELALTLRQDPRSSCSTTATALQFYVRVYGSRAAKLERETEAIATIAKGTPPAEACCDPASWFAAEAEKVHVEMLSLEAQELEDEETALDLEEARIAAREDELARALANRQPVQVEANDAAPLDKESPVDAHPSMLRKKLRLRGVSGKQTTDGVRPFTTNGAADELLEDIDEGSDEVEQEEVDDQELAREQLDGSTCQQPAHTPKIALPKLEIPLMGLFSSDSRSADGSQTTARGTAAAALVSARSARQSGALSARTAFKPQSVGISTPRDGKDVDERSERDAACAGREAPPSARRRVSLTPGDTILSEQGARAPKIALPKLEIPLMGLFSSDSRSADGSQTTARGTAAAALVSARSARQSGALSARTAFKPQSVGISTPRDGKDVDERSERDAACAGREAPPSARRRVLATAAQPHKDSCCGSELRGRSAELAETSKLSPVCVDNESEEWDLGLSGSTLPAPSRCPVPMLSIPSFGASLQSARGCASIALESARDARRNGSMTARTELKQEAHGLGILTPRSNKDADERADRGSISKERAPSARRRSVAEQCQQAASSSEPNPGLQQVC